MAPSEGPKSSLKKSPDKGTEREDARPSTFVVAVPHGIAPNESFDVAVPGRGAVGPLYGALYAGHSLFELETGVWLQHKNYQTMVMVHSEGHNVPKPKVVLDVGSESVLTHPEEIREPPEAYARWHELVLKIEVALCFKYVTVQQARDLVQLFPEGDDTVRSLVLTTLFGRVLDLENLYCLVDLLGPEGQMDVFHRLGHLNVLSPHAAERWYELDLSKLDEREMCRVLAKLAVKESRDSWHGEYFKHKKLGGEWVEGWDGPGHGWEADDPSGGAAELGAHGPPIEGAVHVQYHARHSRNMATRADLAKRFLCGQQQAAGAGERGAS